MKRTFKHEILELLSDYEDSENINYHKVIKLMLYEVYDFPKIQNQIYQYLIKRINENQEDGVKSFPNPREKSVVDLYTLSSEGYFSDFDILKDIKVDIRGLYPEIDWTWYRDRSENVIHRLLEYRTPNNIKSNFQKMKKIIN